MSYIDFFLPDNVHLWISDTNICIACFKSKTITYDCKASITPNCGWTSSNYSVWLDAVETSIIYSLVQGGLYNPACQRLKEMTQIMSRFALRSV